MKSLNQFIGLYPLSKTIRFKLIPVGKTKETFYASGILNRDRKRADDYPAVKQLIDECHKYLINESLRVESANLDWNPLQDAIMAYRRDKSDENKKNLETIQGEMRSNIFEMLKKGACYADLTAATPDKLLKSEKLLDTILPDNSNGKSEIKSFTRFATYFQGFQENRRNIYTDEAISTGVPYRTVHDNFPKFLTNIEVYNTIKEVCPEVLIAAEKELLPFLDGVCLDDVFSVEFYNSLLNQNGIDYFNQILGGVTLEEGEKKLRGINEFVNLYRQQHPEVKTKKRGLTMVPLFKQILSDRETFSFIPQTIGSDQELVDIIKAFHENITHMEVDGEKENVIEKLCSLLSSIKEYDAAHIYINAKSITTLSQSVCKSWSHINDCLKRQAIEIYGTNTKSALKKVDSYLKRDAYSLAELSCVDADLTSYFTECADMQKEITDKFALFADNVTTDTHGDIKNDAIKTELTKKLLDTYMKLLHTAEIVAVSEELDIDKSFYTTFSRYYEALRAIIPLYTKVRNYLTQKPYNEEKFKLNFDAPSLAKGWDKNKEKDNKAILLFKDGVSYLAITAPSANVKWDEFNRTTKDGYSKMVYKLLPGPNKMLPKVFFSKKGIDTFHPSDYILTGYKEEKFKKGKNFSKKFLHDLIDFYKACISQHPDWKNFGFVFSPTNSYEDISAFYNDISMQGYKLSFVDIPTSDINRLVDEGKIFLFQIYNKDYAEGATGTKNLHTLYWENLFSKENIENLVLKLNGEAELFYRMESVKKPVVHKVGEKMVNKRCKMDGSVMSGMPIPDNIYQELYRYYNGKMADGELSQEAKGYLSHVAVKDVTHEIIKDRRYTQPHFQFHVPLTINFRASGNDRVNEMVNEYLKNNPDVNIIGLDRGERHLIYLSLINQKGEILKQKTFNIVNQMDYQAKLAQREKERDEARKSWKSVGKIKELKEGYLSAVIHEITTMMVEYNAIVVMEDLNFGFKRGRFKIERQVYQKFEKMLIDKLNYLPFKNRKADQPGGILRGYQLTEKFVSFQRMGKQSGFLFYIPAAYTSKIDPVSGFVNIFNFNDVTNAESRKEFFENFDKIRFLSENDGFEFTFNYDNERFKTHQTDYTKVWTVSTRGKRIVMQDDNGHKKPTDYYPTDALIEAFGKVGVTLKPGMDVLAEIRKIKAGNQTATFFSELLFAFKSILQMRNSNPLTGEDYIISPVQVAGKYYCSKDEAEKGPNATLPTDADANGAYHIALKGLFTIMYPGTKIEHAKWLEFMQTKPYKW